MLSPALIWPPLDPEAMAGERAVRRRLARARSNGIEPRSTLALTARALGIDMPPAAALARLAENRPADPAWFLAEPVMLTPDRDCLLLRRLGRDALGPDEAQALIETAHGHFSEKELRLERTAQGRWYACLGGIEPRAGLAVEAAEEGVSIPATPDSFGVSLEGLRILNELQMLWFEHPVNRERKQAGRLQANALWVWGGGALPDTPPEVDARVLAADGAEWAGLAQWLGLEYREQQAAGAGDIEPGLIVALGVNAETAGGRWLKAFCGQRSAFRVFAAGRMWNVPGRGFRRRW